jgi:hypothetical protein
MELRQQCSNITFSPPDKLAIFFQLFFGGLTLKTTPSEKGNEDDTSSINYGEKKANQV